jgi:1,4-dihydroxy-2-naphthoate polyprenyltransferase
VEISEHNFASTQPINPLPGQPLETSATRQSADDRRLQRLLYSAPVSSSALLLRMVHVRAALALFVPTVAGAVLGWWHTGRHDVATLMLLLSSAFCLILGMNLLNDNHDYRYAQKSNDIKFTNTLFATPYHLLAAGQIQSRQVSLLGYALLLYSLISQLGLVLLVGWPVLFFYLLSLLLLYTYATPPIRYGYRGWALGEIGVFLGYGILPLIGSYFIVGRTINWLPLWVSLPFGLLTVLIFFNHNLLHYRRDWLMRKRTLVVTFGPLRTFDISALLTLIVYASLLAIASLAHLPLTTLVTLAALPLALGLFSRLRSEQPHVEDVVRLHLTTLNASIWTGILFCAALLADKAFS